MSGFSRVLRTYREELARPDYAAKVAALRTLTAELQAAGLPVRLDHGRDWENPHVLLELERLRAAGGVQRVLEHGGGNSPVAYLLARDGLDVDVLDVDRPRMAELAGNARRIGLGERLRGVVYDGMEFPLGDDRYDVVTSISVFEGLTGRQRACFFAEVRRVLRPGGSLLLTFDYGEGARFVSDPPVSPAEVQREIVEASGMELVGEPFTVPEFDPAIGPPVKAIVPTVDGLDQRVAAYSFGAVHLRAPG